MLERNEKIERFLYSKSKTLKLYKSLCSRTRGFQSKIVRLIFIVTHFRYQEYNLINIKVVSALVPGGFFFYSAIYFSCRRSRSARGFGAKSGDTYLRVG